MSFHPIKTLEISNGVFILAVNTTTNKFGFKKADSENWEILESEFNFHGPLTGGSWVDGPVTGETSEERRRKIATNNNEEYKTFDELKIWFFNEFLKKPHWGRIRSLEDIQQLWRLCVNMWDGLEMVWGRDRRGPLYPYYFDYTQAREEICTVIHKLDPSLNPSDIQLRVSYLK